MPSKANWIEQLSTEANDTARRVGGARHRYSLALLLRRIEPDFKGVEDLVVATRTQFWAAQLNAEAAQLSLGAAGTYVGDNGLSDHSEGKIVAHTGAEIKQLREVARETSAEAMQVRLSVLYASD